MYTRYFGLTEKPFTLTPNPRFIFLSNQHREAFAHLLYGINNRHGFIELIGEVGTGKTTVLRTLLAQLQERDYRIALIFNTCMTAVELLRNIGQEYGLETTGVGSNDLLSGLNSFLLKENAGGRTVVLVIDEAQNLQPDVLEQLRLISNLETENEKLIQIILAGQPELENILQRHSLRQLNQRIAVRCRLGTMGRAETGAYIRHRLERAGATTGVSFSSLAVFLVYLSSRGIPRKINILCDRALLTAYAHGHRTVSSLVVLRAMNELHGVSRRRLVLICRFTAGVVLLAMVGLLAWSRFPALSFSPESPSVMIMPLPLRKGGLKPIGGGAPPSPAATGLPDSPESGGGGRLELVLLQQGLNNVHIGAFNGLMARWQAKPIRLFRGTLSVPGTFAELAAKRNLRCTAFQGSLDDVIRFDIPFLLSTRASEKKGRYCLAVTAVRGKLLTVSPSLLKGGIVGRNDLAQVADGTYYLLWYDSAHIPDSLAPGERRHELRTLQRLLKQAGFYREVVDGRYNAATISAVRQFQRSRGIPVNDSGGELTMALLSRYDTSQMAPSLSGI
jgi:general secretion pathway protein A